MPTAHEPFDREDGVLRIRDGLAPGHLTHEALPIFAEGHHRRRQATPLLVGDYDWVSAFHDCHHRVGCPEVNANNFPHGYPPGRLLELEAIRPINGLNSYGR
jgi:hypothetical protein